MIRPLFAIIAKQPDAYLHCIMRFLSFLFLITPNLIDPASGASNSQSLLESLDEVPVLHFTLSRRGGVFTATVPGNDWVNLTYLTQELDRTECRFNLTKREAKGNKLVRKAKADETGGKDSGTLMGDIATNGTWYVGFAAALSTGSLGSPSSSSDRYAMLKIGEPPQEIEMDLNMLVSDFYVTTTSSKRGNKYDDYFSKSHCKMCTTAEGNSG